MCTASALPSKYLILCRPLLLPSSVFPSIRVFSNEFVLHIRWPKYCSFSFRIGPSNENSGMISFRIDWLDLLVVKGTQDSPTPRSKASIIQCSAFFIVQLWHPHVTTGKTIALTRRTLLGATMGDPTHDKGHAEEPWQARADQASRDSLNLLEHPPQNQNLSVLLFFAFHQLFWH